MPINRVLSFVLILFFSNSEAQSVFEKSYSVEINSEFSYISQLKLLPDSSYIFSTTAYDNFDNFLLLGRIDQIGNIIWVKKFNDSFTIREANLDIDSTSAIYLTFSASNGIPLRYYSTIHKLDPSGNILWSQSFGDSLNTHASEHIFYTPDAIYLAGEIYINGSSDLFLIKVDTTGNYIWGYTFNTGGIDYLRDALKLNNGDILLSGLSTDSLNQYYNSLFRINSNGAIVWKKRYHTPTFREFNGQSMCENSDGTIIISGYADSLDIASSIYFGKWDISIMKLNNSGDFLWGKIYGGSDFDEVWQVYPTEDAGYIFAAEPESFGNVSRISLMKTDSLANIQWMKLYGKETGGFPNNIVINPDKGYSILASDGDYNVSAPMIFIRTDSLGNSMCQDTIVSLPQLPFTPIVDTIGWSNTLNGELSFSPAVSNFALIMNDYCIPNFISTISEGAFLQVYPNPFLTELNLSVSKQSLNKLNLNIYNTIGLNVYSEVHHNVDQYSTKINCANFPKGLYLIEIFVDEERIVRKILKQ